MLEINFYCAKHEGKVRDVRVLGDYTRLSVIVYEKGVRLCEVSANTLGSKHWWWSWRLEEEKLEMWLWWVVIMSSVWVDMRTGGGWSGGGCSGSPGYEDGRWRGWMRGRGTCPEVTADGRREASRRQCDWLVDIVVRWREEIWLQVREREKIRVWVWVWVETKY